MALKNGRTTASLQTILIGSVIPPGVIQAFGGGTVPSGWLLCDGSTASRSTYAGLFAAIGIVNGQGDGSTTFHLPDLRGRFLRGADNMGTGAAGRDPGDNKTASNAGGSATGIGSVQSDAMQGHMHGWRGNKTINFAGGGSQWGVANASSINYPNNDGTLIMSPSTDSVNGTPRTTTESRPQNANSSYIIKV